MIGTTAKSDRRGPTPRPRRRLAEAFNARLTLHLRGLVSSLGRSAARPWATLSTVGVMALALALPLGLWLGLENLERFSAGARDSRDIGLFLKPEFDPTAGERLAETLRARPDVAAVSVRTPEQGLAEFRSMSELAPALDLLDHNPLPTVLVLTPAADADGDAIAREMAKLDAVEIVQHDALWRQRLDRWLAFGERLALVIAILLSAGALMVVGNTVRLDVQSRQEEIAVLQQLGADDGFIRRPFLYLGLWYGLAAGVLALVLVAAAGAAVREPLSRLLASYGSVLEPSGPVWPTLLAAIVLAAALGWLGAWLAAQHHLRRTRPVEV